MRWSREQTPESKMLRRCYIIQCPTTSHSESHNLTVTFDNYCNKETCIFQKRSTPLFFDQEISLLQAKFSNILWRSTLENNCQGILPSCKSITKDFITVRKEELCDYPYMKAHTHTSCPLHKHIYRIYIYLKSWNLVFLPDEFNSN